MQRKKGYSGNDNSSLAVVVAEKKESGTKQTIKRRRTKTKKLVLIPVLWTRKKG
jgi:hypothetical protein